jgi:acyl-CoA thioester hydrolase
MSVGEAYRVQMRWSDIDALGHVNHALAFSYFEEGRDAFLAERGIRRDEYVVGRCSVSWIAEIMPGDDAVIVETSVSALGVSSVTTSERILDARGNVVVEGEFGLVLWDPDLREARAITETEREALSSAAPIHPPAEEVPG